MCLFYNNYVVKSSCSSVDDSSMREVVGTTRPVWITDRVRGEKESP